MRVDVFEDPGVGQLEPVTLGRAAYSLQCGSFCLADWLQRLQRPVRGLVRPYLQPWQAAEFPQFTAAPGDGDWRLVVNARLVPCRNTLSTLQQLAAQQRPGLILQGETLAAAMLPPEVPDLRQTWEPGALTSWLRHPRAESLPMLEAQLPLWNYPHELVSLHVEHLADNLEDRIASGGYREIRQGVFASSNTDLAALVHTDTSRGPIVLESGCCVKPFTCLRGPLYVGSFSVVNEHSILKSGVSVGPMCKVGGEVEASVIEGYSNKQHLGYLGHSYLGRWVNLGAGTSNSNLKNTYGNVRMELDDRRVDTGLQFMGCVIGDFTKSAINTAIFTGKLIGCCSMLYGFITTNVPSFVNYAQSFGDITQLTPAVMAQTQKRIFLRRGIQQQPWHVQLLHDMYQRAAHGHQLADRPVSL
jgi:glucose-1-phosphate thymidylyltransferase